MTSDASGLGRATERLESLGGGQPTFRNRAKAAAKRALWNSGKVFGVAVLSLGILYLIQKLGDNMSEEEIFSGKNVAFVSIAAGLVAMSAYQLRATIKGEEKSTQAQTKRIWFIAKCLAVGVLAIYFANMYIYHGDINPENHLMQDDIYARLATLGATTALLGYHLHSSAYLQEKLNRATRYIEHGLESLKNRYDSWKASRNGTPMDKERRGTSEGANAGGPSRPATERLDDQG